MGVGLVTPTDLGIVEDIPETAETLEGNALQKARYVYDIRGLTAHSGVPTFADDTGLEVAALGGAPGVYSARYAGVGCSYDDNCRLLLRNLEGVADRRARFRTVVALILDGNEYLFEGTVEGKIIGEYRGEGGFGYDPIFVPDGFRETFAQMSAEQKNAISHRGRAMANLAEFLKTKNL